VWVSVTPRAAGVTPTEGRTSLSHLSSVYTSPDARPRPPGAAALRRVPVSPVSGWTWAWYLSGLAYRSIIQKRSNDAANTGSGGVRGMVSAAIPTDGRVRAGIAVRSREDRRNLFGMTLATRGKGAVIFFAVRTRTNRAENASRVAEIRVMAPRITARAERESDLHGRLSEKADNATHIEGAVDEGPSSWNPSESPRYRSRLCRSPTVWCRERPVEGQLDGYCLCRQKRQG
jgi:hypothetical protein